MAIAEIVLRLVGGFYVFAGLASMRAIALDKMMDQMLSAISLKPQPAIEAQKRALWLVSTLAIGMGGAALVVLNAWALPLFCIGLATQALYLLWARRTMVPETELEARGRRQTINAALLYAVAMLAVCLAFALGLFGPFADPIALVAPATGLFMLLTVGRHLIWSPRHRPLSGLGDIDAETAWPDPEPIPPLSRVRLEPRWGRYALIDADSDADRQPGLYLPEALALRIHHWMYNFSADDASRELIAEFEDEIHEATHRREGEAIVAELKAIFGADNASGPFYPDRKAYIGPDASSSDTAP